MKNNNNLLLAATASVMRKRRRRKAIKRKHQYLVQDICTDETDSQYNIRGQRSSRI